MAKDEALTELLAWTRIIGMRSLRELLEIHLKTGVDFDVYEATDGSRNRDEVGQAAGIKGRSVGNRWAVWREVGIIVDPTGSDHPTHLASPAAVGYARPTGDG